VSGLVVRRIIQHRKSWVAGLNPAMTHGERPAPDPLNGLEPASDLAYMMVCQLADYGDKRRVE
jgi:hypothetical protein